MINVSPVKKDVVNTPDHTFQNCSKFKNIRNEYNLKDTNWFENQEITTKNTAEYVNSLMRNKEKI